MENQFPNFKRPKLSETLPIRRTLNKYELCLKFQRGVCHHGDRCCFAHCTEDLNKRNESIAVDENRNPWCTEKTKLCWRFMNGDRCPFGEKCHYIHGNGKSESERTSDVIRISNKHLPWKTKLCFRWMSTGTCKFGPNCAYAHGESELQNQGLKDAREYADGGSCKPVDKKEGNLLKVKWKNHEMISRVYADWINDMPIVPHSI